MNEVLKYVRAEMEPGKGCQCELCGTTAEQAAMLQLLAKAFAEQLTQDPMLARGILAEIIRPAREVLNKAEAEQQPPRGLFADIAETENEAAPK